MTINTEKFNRIVEAAKAKTNDPKWLRAISKAAAAILDGSMIVTVLAHGALVTTPGGTYACNGNCACPARTKHCYHRAGARLMDIYETADLAVSTPAPYCGDRDLQHLADRAPHAPKIIRSVERNVRSRVAYTVVTVDNWVV